MLLKAGCTEMVAGELLSALLNSPGDIMEPASIHTVFWNQCASLVIIHAYRASQSLTEDLSAFGCRFMFAWQHSLGNFIPLFQFSCWYGKLMRHVHTADLGGSRA